MLKAELGVVKKSVLDFGDVQSARHLAVFIASGFFGLIIRLGHGYRIARVKAVIEIERFSIFRLALASRDVFEGDL